MDITKQYALPFPIETLYDAWVSSDTVIPPATRMDITPTVSGELFLYVESPQFNATMKGVFKEIIPNEKLVYSWEWNGDGEVTEVTVQFSSNDDGTTIDISHTGWEKETSQEMHDSGWDSYIQGLTAFLSSKN